MSFSIRPARAHEQWPIRWIVWRARINPFDLDWRRFVVAEDDSKIVGAGQIKPHADGSRELASIAVLKSHQQHGIGSMIVRAHLANEPGPLFLICRAPLETFYARFGFRIAIKQELSPYFQRIARLNHLFRQPLIVMLRPPN